MIMMIDWLLQLTDNVTLSTAGAAGNFLVACRAAVDRATNATNANETAGMRAAVDKELECNCHLNRPVQECCGNGKCHAEICHCNTGWLHTELSATTF